MMSLGQIIATRRKVMGQSLADVARRGGLSKPHVHQLETGVSVNPTVETLLSLAAALGVSADVLFRAAVQSQTADAIEEGGAGR